MKGQIAEHYSPDPGGEYSDLQVMRSGAGWYIGTLFTYTNGSYKGFQEPGSRESGYYATEEEAQAAMDACSWDQRAHP